MATQIAPMPGAAPIAYSTVEWERMHDDHPTSFGDYNPSRGSDKWAFEMTVTTMLRREPTVHKITMTGAYDIAYVSVMAMAREMAYMADVEDVLVTLAH